MPATDPPNDAWVEMAIPAPLDVVWAFIADPQRLFRLHPHLVIKRWAPLDGEGIETVFEHERHALRLSRILTPIRGHHRLTIHYDTGLKRETRVTLRPGENDSTVLELRETYAPPDTPGYADQLGEVDPDLTFWGVALRRAILHHRRWRWLPGHARLWERLWLHATPVQRRVIRLLIWSSVLEFLFFLALVAGMNRM